MRAFIFIFVVAMASLALLSGTNVITLLDETHTINDLTSNANNINCTGCHQKMRNQLENSSIHSNFDCEECHRLAKTAEGKTIKYATHNSSGITVGNESHAAYTPRCLDCHEGDGVYYNNSWVQKQAPTAIAFNESSYGSNYSAHKPFVEQALDWGLSKGENEACIACHTNYSMEIEFKRPEWFQFYVEKQSQGLDVSSVSYGSTNTTTVHKSDSGAKHEFLEANMGGIKCERCHSDIWKAANHTIEDSGDHYSTNASHVCWQFQRGNKEEDDCMHNVTCIYSEYGVQSCYEYGDTIAGHYDNITEYCTLSCHNPIIGESSTWSSVPDTFQATTHAAHRVSCYDCHDVSIESDVYYYRKPNNDYIRCDSKHTVGDITEPLFLHGETCIACKRDSAKDGTYKTWTEPNNTMYDVGGGYYI